jgi:peptidoglycan hydrolase CwlO-like protein
MTGCLLVLSSILISGTGLASAESQKAEGNKGITVDDLGRGLKSAAQNVEKEIPKIGSAIGETFKKITDKRSDNRPTQEAPQSKK